MSKHILPTTVMAIYCFLRFPASFERAVKSALLLGGHHDALASTVGGWWALMSESTACSRALRSFGRLAAHAGLDRSIGDASLDWPHGVEDLLLAPGENSYPLAQLVRNATRWPWIAGEKVTQSVW